MTGSDASAGIEVIVTGVKTIDGDVTVGQRKSKCVSSQLSARRARALKR